MFQTVISQPEISRPLQGIHDTQSEFEGNEKLMTAVYRIDPQRSLLYYLFYGRCPSTELSAIVKSASQDPDVWITRHIIFDVLDGDLEIELDEVRAALFINREMNAQGWYMNKLALLTDNLALGIFGKSYELLAIGLPVEVRVFPSIAACLPWLELESHHEQVAMLRADILRQVKAIRQ